jgi:hypothetical protein
MEQASTIIAIAFCIGPISFSFVVESALVDPYTMKRNRRLKGLNAGSMDEKINAARVQCAAFGNRTHSVDENR